MLMKKILKGNQYGWLGWFLFEAIGKVEIAE